MLLNEDLFEVDIPDIINTDIDISELEPTVPEAGPSIGVETMLMQAIKDIYGIIEVSCDHPCGHHLRLHHRPQRVCILSQPHWGQLQNRIFCLPCPEVHSGHPEGIP